MSNIFEEYPINRIIQSQGQIDLHNDTIHDAGQQLRGVNEMVSSGEVSEGEVADFYRDALNEIILENTESRGEFSKDIPYEGIAIQSLILEREVANIMGQIKDHDDTILIEADRLAGVAPLVADMGNDFALKKAVDHNDGFIKSLQNELAETQAELDRVNIILENTGTPWPLVTSTNALSEPVEEDPGNTKAPNTEPVDVVPVSTDNPGEEQTESDDNGSSGDRDIKRKPRLKTEGIVTNAGEEVVKFLVKNQGQIFTYSQMGEAIYSDKDVEGETRPDKGTVLSSAQRKSKRARIIVAHAFADDRASMDGNIGVPLNSGRAPSMRRLLVDNDLVLIKIPLTRQEAGEGYTKVGVTIIPRQLAKSYGFDTTGSDSPRHTIDLTGSDR
jgi:hypothetical protein